MPIVCLPSIFISETKKNEIEIAGESLIEVLVNFELKFPNLKNRILKSKNEIQPFIRVCVGAKSYSGVQVKPIELSPKDKLKVVIAMAGG